MNVYCPDCGLKIKFEIGTWRCKCGGAWEIADLPMFEPQKIDTKDRSIWRYGSLLGLDLQKPRKIMGVGWTPIIPTWLNDRRIYLKLEYLMPSGSFKDRGVNAMINQFSIMGVDAVVEDSSGNAGASVAAHGARFRINTKIYVPESALQKKINQITVYGADVVRVPGTRKDTERMAQNSINSETAYASHSYNPSYLAGQTTLAFEIWEQLEGNIPDWIICPLGQGGQFLGLWFGFSRLFEAGLINRLPHLAAVQSENIAPVYHAWKNCAFDMLPVESSDITLADGVAINKPVRSKRILQALRETKGLVFTASNDEILSGQRDLARMGYFVEPTSALVIVALKYLSRRVKENCSILVSLTGNGLKGSSEILFDQ